MSVSTEVDAATLDSTVAEAAVVDAVTADTARWEPGSGPGTCPNCRAPRTGRFCAACGQKAAPLAPTLGYFAREVAHEILNVDGKIFRSLRFLVTRPGFLTRELFAGRRASYVSPIRLYLTASVLAFAAMTFFGGFGDVDFQYTPGPGETVDPAVVERMSEMERTVTTALAVWVPRAMFVLVPLFAALVMLFRRGGGHTYPQHLYFALHVHAAVFLASAVNTLLEPLARFPYVATTAGIVLSLYVAAYFFLAFRRVYETTILSTLWRTVAVGLLYSVALMVTVAAIVAPTVLPLFRDQSP
jgi:hypothetical protein